MAKGFKGPKMQNPGGMMNQLKKLQEQMEVAQAQLAEETRHPRQIQDTRHGHPDVPPQRLAESPDSQGGEVDGLEGDDQAEQGREQRLDERATRQAGYNGEPRHHEREELRRAEVQRHPGKPGTQQHEHDGGEGAGDE